MNFLHPDDTPEMAITKLSGGDKLAERTLKLITSTAEMAEPDRASQSIPEPLILLDALEIVGEQVLSLHKACGSSPFKTVAIIRAYELGLIGSPEIKDVANAIPAENGKVPTLDVDGLTAKVREFLPKFGLGPAVSSSRGATPENSASSCRPVPSVPKNFHLGPSQQHDKGKGGVGGH